MNREEGEDHEEEVNVSVSGGTRCLPRDSSPLESPASVSEEGRVRDDGQAAAGQADGSRRSSQAEAPHSEEVVHALFLDDDPQRWRTFRGEFVGGDATWVRSAAEAVRVLESDPGRFSLVFLDHDLEPEHYASGEVSRSMARTGASVAGWMAAHSEVLRPDLWVVIHSLNYAGGRRMYHLLAGLWSVTIDPFAWIRASEYLQRRVASNRSRTGSASDR